MKEKGELNSTQMKWFVPTKPTEELYDLSNDPYELNNLATDPKQQATLKRFRKEMDRWLTEAKDLGAVEEKQCLRRCGMVIIHLQLRTWTSTSAATTS